jgi:hypothetical protein
MKSTELVGSGRGEGAQRTSVMGWLINLFISATFLSMPRFMGSLILSAA